MENTQKKPLLPYLRGGVPGTLTVMLFASAIAAILALVVLQVAIGVSLTGKLKIALVCLPAVLLQIPVIIAGFGALRLRRGNPEGAAMLTTACGVQRILMTVILIGLALILTGRFLENIGDCSRNLANGGKTDVMIAYLIEMLVFVLLMVLLSGMVLYFGRLRDVARCVEDELRAGGEITPGYAPRVPMSFSILLAVLAFLALVACSIPDIVSRLSFRALPVESLKDLRDAAPILYRIEWGMTLLEANQTYRVFAVIALCLVTLLCCLITGFLGGFRRSHAILDRTDASLRSPGYRPLYALIMTGEILCARHVLTLFIRSVWDATDSGMLLSTPDVLWMVLWAAGYVLLSIALVSEKRRALTVAGALSGIAAQAWALAQALFGTAGERAPQPVDLACQGVFLLFFVLLFVAAIVAAVRKKKAPAALRILALIAGQAVILIHLIGLLHLREKTVYTAENFKLLGLMLQDRGALNTVLSFAALGLIAFGFVILSLFTVHRKEPRPEPLGSGADNASA